MTNNRAAGSSSLFRARNTHHVHRHSHSLQHASNHAHFHDDLRRREADDDDDDDPPPAEVTEVVSIVQWVNSNGQPIRVQTISATPMTQLSEGSDLAASTDVSADAAAPTLAFEAAGTHSLPALVNSTSSRPEATPLTSAPSPGPSGYSPFSGGFNSTSSSSPTP